MSEYKTNGYLVSLLEHANDNGKHPEHAEAQAYLTKFRDLEGTFFRDVHPYVDMGLAMSEVGEAGENTPSVYTVHGCRHISDLIKSLDKFAKEISKGPAIAITVLEAYILLCAAHVHDAANVSKRKNHPERCDDILTMHKGLFASITSQQIYDVARVHGGSHPEFGRDTFRSINSNNSTPPRLFLLAAFLRLGDELSENEERVPQIIVDHHPISEESKLAHAYAKSFVSFEFRNESLYITYGIYPSEHRLTATINGQDISFYDFLESKVDVIDREARYCSQYARPSFNISEITITIHQYQKERPSPVSKSETFTLHLNHGYPDLEHTLCQRSPELSGKRFEKLRDCFVEQPPSV
jgi:hypothetical protein